MRVRSESDQRFIQLEDAREVNCGNCGLRIQAVSATRKVPPFLTWGAELTGLGAEDPPHAAMPSPGTARAPAAARLFSTARLSISMLARAGSPLSGGFDLALIGTSLVCRG